MQLEIRSADPSLAADVEGLRLVGTAAGSHDVDEAYFSFVASEGRLLVAVDAADDAGADVGIVGYAGSVPVAGATMITDLFVHPSVQGRGVGASLAAAVAGRTGPVQTCSSQHLAAQHVYRSLGLEVRTRLLYLVGSCVGGGPPFASGRWGHHRAPLVEHFRACGALVGTDTVVLDRDGRVQVLRLQHPEPHLEVQRVSASFPTGRPLQACVPESTALASWMLDHGFEVADHDVVMARRDTLVDESVSIVHAGLW